MMQGPASNPNGDNREMGDSGFDLNRLKKEGNIVDQKDIFQSRIDSADLKELVSILRELFEHNRTQLGQYGLEGFNDSLRNRDLGRVRSTIPKPTEAARPPGEHFTPREFEALLQGFLQTNQSEHGAIRRFATNMNDSVYGLTRMTKRIEPFKREIPDDYFSDVSSQDLIKLANFYSPNSPEAPVLYEAMTAALVEINQEKNPIQVRLEIANTINNERLEDFLQAAALLLEKNLAKRLIDTATPADEPDLYDS